MANPQFETILLTFQGEVFRPAVLQPLLHWGLHRGGHARRHHQRRRRRAGVQVRSQVCDIQVSKDYHTGNGL